MDDSIQKLLEYGTGGVILFVTVVVIVTVWKTTKSRWIRGSLVGFLAVGFTLLLIQPSQPSGPAVAVGQSSGFVQVSPGISLRLMNVATLRRDLNENLKTFGRQETRRMLATALDELALEFDENSALCMSSAEFDAAIRALNEASSAQILDRPFAFIRVMSDGIELDRYENIPFRSEDVLSIQRSGGERTGIKIVEPRRAIRSRLQLQDVVIIRANHPPTNEDFTGAGRFARVLPECSR